MKTNTIHAAALIAAIALALTACAPAEDDLSIADMQEEIGGLNGLNPASLNLSGSGVRSIDAGYAGLNATALQANQTWRNWISQDTLAPTTFGYLVQCALDAGQSIPAISINGRTYGPWAGLAGLATNWVNGGAQTQDEQQLVTGCLLAFANVTGYHVWISMRSIALPPANAAEASQFSKFEGQFFGNVFTATAVKGVCRADGANAATSTELAGVNRLCADDPALCGFTDYGACSEVCDDFDSIQGVYSSCGGYETVASFIDASF